MATKKTKSFPLKMIFLDLAKRSHTRNITPPIQLSVAKRPTWPYSDSFQKHSALQTLTARHIHIFLARKMVLIPTFRLFVKHSRPLNSVQEEKELKALFEVHGKVVSFSTKKDWHNSLVSFATTQEAVAARKVDDTRFNGERLKILFTRPTRRVLALDRCVEK